MFAQKLFLSREFNSPICDSLEGSSFLFIQCLLLSTLSRHQSNLEIDLIEFIEIVMVDINIKLTLTKVDN